MNRGNSVSIVFDYVLDDADDLCDPYVYVFIIAVICRYSVIILNH
jgi:hypothetical protein